MTRTILFVLALGPGIINYMWLSPALWSHNSSAAFEMWMFLWFCSIALPIWVLCLPSGKPSRGGDEREDQ